MDNFPEWKVALNLFILPKFSGEILEPKDNGKLLISGKKLIKMFRCSNAKIC
jgi:hypothetical protein